MTSTIVQDQAGVKIRVGVDVGGIITPKLQGTPEEICTIFRSLKDFTFREDDIMLCTYSKTGTNWMYEVLSMINSRSAERVKTNKIMTMMEVVSQERLDKIPSPRVLNSHLPLSDPVRKTVELLVFNVKPETYSKFVKILSSFSS